MSPSALLPEVKIDRLQVVAAKVGDGLEVRPQCLYVPGPAGFFTQSVIQPDTSISILFHRSLVSSS